MEKPPKIETNSFEETTFEENIAACIQPDKCKHPMYQVPHLQGQRRGLNRFEASPSSCSLEQEDLNLGKGSERIRVELR